MTQKQTEAMTQAEQIFDDYLLILELDDLEKHLVIASIQEALDIREKELEALREWNKKLFDSRNSNYPDTDADGFTFCGKCGKQRDI